jgi:NTE family protein
VLSGGGARGFAHIGVLRAFREADIPIDFIAGASMGAIVAAQHAMGFDSQTMMNLMRESYVHPRGLPDLTIPFVAVRTGVATDRQLKRMFGDTRIEDLRIPYFSVSANLITAETVIHDRGRLWRGVRSSCSVPGLLPPVRVRGGFLVDGGLLDNLPVGAMRARCAGSVVASDVSVAVDLQMRDAARYRRRRFRIPWRSLRMPGIGSILMRTVQLASVKESRLAGTPADLYLHPPVDDLGMNDFARLEEIVERGQQYALERLAEWPR